MGIFTRFSDIVNSNINAILDKAEDPEKMIGQTVADMKAGLSRARSELVQAMGTAKRLEKQAAELDDLVEESLKRAALWDEVKDRLDEPAATLSGGQQQRLCLARTLTLEPEVILLDEPTSGMSRSETERATGLIQSIAKERTVVVVEHDMGVVFELAQRISVLVYGEIIASDFPEKISGNPRVQEAYLGAEAVAQE